MARAGRLRAGPERKFGAETGRRILAVQELPPSAGARLLLGVANAALKLRAEVVERRFAHVLDRGGIRRASLRGRENIHKRYRNHVAGHILGLLMRLMIDAGTAKEAIARDKAFGLLVPLPDGSVLVLLAAIAGNRAFIVAIFA